LTSLSYASLGKDAHERNAAGGQRANGGSGAAVAGSSTSHRKSPAAARAAAAMRAPVAMVLQRAAPPRAPAEIAVPIRLVEEEEDFGEIID